MPIKKTIYILLTMLLGLILSFLAHALIEINFIKYLLAQGLAPANQTAFGYGYCVLPVALQFGLIVLGLIGGYFLGQWWWKIVYIEKRSWGGDKRK